MIRKLIGMNWTSDFQCTGAECPMNCCRGLVIQLVEGELEKIRSMPQTVRDEMLGMIDEEKGEIKMSEGQCPMLTSEGWCGLVQKYGTEHMLYVCDVFPREENIYDDILEITISIACPVAAEYLLTDKKIEFVCGEMEWDGKAKLIDKKAFLNLYKIRTHLINMMQEFRGRYSYAKVSVMLEMIQKIRMFIEQETMDSLNSTEFLNDYVITESELRRRESNIDSTERIESKKRIYEQMLNLIWKEKNAYYATVFAQKDESLNEQIEIWRENPKILEEDILNFEKEHQNRYPYLFEKFFVYGLFKDWIEMDFTKFGNTMEERCVEWAWIWLWAMAAWKTEGEISKKRYECIIAHVERMTVKWSESKEFIEQQLRDGEEWNSKKLAVLCGI